ncbi:hypothetical protein HPB52_010434 [Rhipicephalus sanguineus]|uniref:Uncharacterized protein n=1 Tax=Rhipicephalus sanguineus TaxID=34632 RepID=A0A9D4QD86_RHISA|nr:hypothetical protein HPB52_010434 [Rhipicephalus sanguineus]
MYSTTCSKCENRIAYKDMRKHYTACGGKTGVFIRSVDVRSLIDNMEDAFENLEEALASAEPDDRERLQNTVDMVREQFARIQDQLEMSVPDYMPASKLPCLGT